MTGSHSPGTHFPICKVRIVIPVSKQFPDRSDETIGAKVLGRLIFIGLVSPSISDSCVPSAELGARPNMTGRTQPSWNYIVVGERWQISKQINRQHKWGR